MNAQEIDPRTMGEAFRSDPGKAAVALGARVARTPDSAPGVLAVYIPFPRSERFVAHLAAHADVSAETNVLAEMLGHHVLGHDRRRIIAWAPLSECPFAQIDQLWGIAFTHPAWSNAEVASAYNEQRRERAARLREARVTYHPAAGGEAAR